MVVKVDATVGKKEISPASYQSKEVQSLSSQGTQQRFDVLVRVLIGSSCLFNEKPNLKHSEENL